MGAQIAAHLANAGIAVTLVDVSKEAAEAGLARLRSLKPDPFFLPGAARLIEVTDIEQLGALSSADWVIEAVVESLDVKRNLLSTVAPHLAPTAVVSSSSGVSVITAT